jgi:predicted O-methyltransferase YrrM
VSGSSRELKRGFAWPVAFEDRRERLIRSLDQRAAERMATYGPRARPVVLLADRFWSAIFDLRRSWRERANADLAAATSVDACIDAVGRVLSLNQKRGEIIAFLEWTRGITPHRLCEIGVESGGTHLLFKRALPQIELTIGIDLYVRQKHQLRTFTPPGQESVLIDGSSYNPQTFARVAEALGGRSLDVLFIDGDHSFAGAAQDFQLYRQLVRRGGIIAFHDIVEDSFLRSGRRTRTYVGEVPELWRQIRAQYGEHREFVDSWTQDGYGIGAIVYDPDVAVQLQPPAAR